jgi:hypothetical protein
MSFPQATSQHLSWNQAILPSEISTNHHDMLNQKSQTTKSELTLLYQWAIFPNSIVGGNDETVYTQKQTKSVKKYVCCCGFPSPPQIV